MLQRSVIVLTFLISCIPIDTKAAGTAGGEMIYEHLGDSTYRFFVRLYQDCANGSAPDSIPICLRDTCNNATLSYLMPQWTGVIPGTGSFPNTNTGLCIYGKTTCDSIGSALPGYKAIWYYKTVTLPTKCNSWKAFTYVSGRNAHIRNIVNPTTSSLYLETTFNNTITNSNSSPFYSIKSFPYVFINTPFTYNNGAIDPDGDSLVSEIIRPLTGVSNCSNTPIGVTYITKTPPISIPSNPIQTNGNFSINRQTGQTNFAIADSGRSTYAIRTREYRNGVLIGSIMKEIQVQSFNGYISYPLLDTFTIGCGTKMPTQNQPIDFCIGQTKKFCFSISTKDTSSRLYLSSDINWATPGATISYIGQGTNIVNGYFTWTPTSSHSNGFFIITTIDSTCRPPGLYNITTQSLPIKVWQKTNAGADKIICPNESTTLKASKGGLYKWSVLSGTSNSLNNTSITNPIASPKVKTTYTVTSNLNAFCTNNKDTVTVDVRPQSVVTRPSITINTPDSNTTIGTTVYFTATTNCNNPSYQWTSMGIKIPGETKFLFSSNSLFNYQSITCLLHCDDTCSSPRDTFSNHITVRIPNSINYLNREHRNSISIFPNPNNGSFTINLGNEIDYKGPVQVDIINALGQVVYSKMNYPKNALIKGITIKNIPTGVYLLKLSTNSGGRSTSFVIKR